MFKSETTSVLGRNMISQNNRTPVKHGTHEISNKMKQALQNWKSRQLRVWSLW